eukprot:GHRR01018632.1.p2 GENE.GHRR01018632.1~~GHRR01018632.1.p2  ORF type:complete len:124 (-),score=15.19 GHRR01018632.1:3338-3709(-)
MPAPGTIMYGLFFCAAECRFVSCQARTCTASGSSQATCEKNAFCAYNVQAKGCAHAQVACPGEDAYDDKMAALMVSTVLTLLAKTPVQQGFTVNGKCYCCWGSDCWFSSIHLHTVVATTHSRR